MPFLTNQATECQVTEKTDFEGKRKLVPKWLIELMTSRKACLRHFNHVFCSRLS